MAGAFHLPPSFTAHFTAHSAPRRLCRFDDAAF